MNVIMKPSLAATTQPFLANEQSIMGGGEPPKSPENLVPFMNEINEVAPPSEPKNGIWKSDWRKPAYGQYR